MTRQLKPSEIFYSQRDITTTFGKSTSHRGEDIGEALDDLVNRRLTVNSFPNITVTKRPGEKKWYTVDNRRLWIFHHYEAYLKNRGQTLEISVNVNEYESVRSSKFSSGNGGTSVLFYKNRKPGGYWWTRITPVVPQYVEPTNTAQRPDCTTDTAVTEPCTESTSSGEPIENTSGTEISKTNHSIDNPTENGKIGSEQTIDSQSPKTATETTISEQTAGIPSPETATETAISDQTADTASPETATETTISDQTADIPSPETATETAMSEQTADTSSLETATETARIDPASFNLNFNTFTEIPSTEQRTTKRKVPDCKNGEIKRTKLTK